MKNKSWTFNATVEHETNSLGWNNFVVVPEPLAQQIKAGVKDLRIIATFNNSIVQHCAMMPRGNGSYFIFVSKEIQKKLNLLKGEEISISIEADTSKYGIPMAEEMEVVFQEEPQAFKLFEELTPGKQRTLIHIVKKVKNPDLRIKKSLAIAEHLIRNRGNLDFKELNEDFRRS